MTTVLPKNIFEFPAGLHADVELLRVILQCGYWSNSLFKTAENTGVSRVDNKEEGRRLLVASSIHAPKYLSLFSPINLMQLDVVPCYLILR